MRLKLYEESSRLVCASRPRFHSMAKSAKNYHIIRISIRSVALSKHLLTALSCTALVQGMRKVIKDDVLRDERESSNDKVSSNTHKMQFWWDKEKISKIVINV